MRPEFKIYRNLHKDCFSVLKWNQDKKGYRLFQHVKDLEAYGVTFRVSQAGRAKVLETKQKNVHAFICCQEFRIYSGAANLGEEIYYDPYKTEMFRFRSSEESILNAESIIMTNNKCYLNVN